MIFKLLTKLSGWRFNPDVPPEARRSVMVAAPHTSNWDAYFMLLAAKNLKLPMRFAIKKSWLRFPMGLLFKPLGAIGIDRSPRKPGEKRLSMVDAMACLFQEHDNLCMAVAPEGTRKFNPKIKTGYYYTALRAGVPISFGYLDYANKEGGVAGVIMPTGDMEADLERIKEAYSRFTGRYPEKTVFGIKPSPELPSAEEVTEGKSQTI